MPPSSSRHKRALLVGINAYPNLPSFAQLEGCVNDVRLVAGLLRDRFGFPEENVTVLTDGAATRAGILAALDALAERVGPDDVVVVHFAGHGSQITDLEGDEPDGLDETIVPHDGVRESGPNTDITDDEIHAWVLRVTARTPYLTLLFDCCHSGTVARDAFGARARALAPDTRPAEALGRAPVATATTRSASTAEGPSGWLPLSERYVLIAGCRDEECSYEYRDPGSGTPHGALTFFLARALAEAVPGTTYRDVYERVRPLVTAHSSKQRPQMEGALDREVFGTRDVEPMRFVGVEARDGRTVTLAAGAAHGLTAGSEWAVYPAGTKRVDDGAEALGRVRITAVGAVTSEAELVGEGAAVAAGTRAVEVAHVPGGLVLRVDVRVPEAYAEAGRALAARIEADALLRAAPRGGGADLRVYLLEAREAVGAGDPVPQLGPLEAPTWAAVGADGRLVCPPHAASEAGVEATVGDNLHAVARYRLALALDNPAAGSALRGRVDVRLKRRVGGEWVDAEAEEAGGEVVFEEGERLAFTVTNRHSEPVYVNALDFGLAGAVQPLTLPGAAEALAPGGTQRVGFPDGIPLAFPAAFPFVEEPGETAASGVETLKVFATTRPTDFSALRQGGVRSLRDREGADTSLAALLRHTFHGVPMRDMVFEAEPDAADDWTAVLRPFVLRRPTAGVALGEDDEALDLGGVVVRTRGLDGQVRVLPSPTFSARTRSVERATDALEGALDQGHVGMRQTVEIQGVRPRGRSAAEPAIEVEVPEVEGQGQVLLSTDESGVMTWHFPEAARGEATRSLGGPATRTFVVRRAAPVPAGEAATRGLMSAVGSKLLKLLVFPLLDPVVGAVGDYFAGRWEGAKRPYGLRPFTPDDYRAPAASGLDGEAWGRLSAGRSLLFVHGTFSRAHTAFGGLSPETMAELHRRYGGRVFAFDHFTASHDPQANVEWFLAALPEAASLDLDVVCHSRGGLVSRTLAENQSAFSLGSRTLDVGRVVFVASPNAGTRLADPAHMGDLVDTYTNLLNFFPPNGVTDVLEGVVTVAKQLAVGALRGLEGLQSMHPDGAFLRGLNALNGRGDARYFALAAAYEPTHPGLADWVRGRLVGRIFGAENDLVVPTASVYADTDADGVDLVAEADRHVFAADTAVTHTGFFRHPAAQEKLLAWLQA